MWILPRSDGQAPAMQVSVVQKNVRRLRQLQLDSLQDRAKCLSQNISTIA